MTQEDTIKTTPETQQQRWLKYGANVVLVSIVVIALAVLLIYLGEKKDKRFDTTASGLYSLKPQTLSLIKDNKQPITIISLYTKAKPGQNGEDTTTDDTTSAPAVDQAGVVSDMLEEYRTRGSHITTETIDPVLNPGKVEDLINQVSDQYSTETEKYKKFIADVPAQYDNISKLANAELDMIKKLPLDQIQSQDVEQSVGLAVVSVQEIPQMMKQAQDAYTRLKKQKPPDYKGITDSVAQTMQSLSDITAKVMDGFKTSKDDKAVPLSIRAYMAESLPHYAQIKKDADDLLARQKALGELKLDTLRDALRQKNPILVRGEKEWRVIPYEKVWKTDTRDMRANSDVAPKPRFAGEQMITSAILALEEPTKPKVCFVRAGGPPITDFGGRLNSVADRLRDYNFDVSEKDLSGMYAMQAMQQQQEAPPEPTDDQIADAVWVVDGVPGQSNPMMGGPPPSIAAKVADHLTKGFHYVDGKKEPGGSAFLLFITQGDDMSGATKPFGITVRTDAMAVHKLIKQEGGGDDTDMINNALHVPFVFTFNQWGDSVITKPLASLESILVRSSPVQVTSTAGVTNTALIPVPGAPNAPECWGETDIASVDTGPTFNKDADIAPPLYAAAMGEKSGQRMVCMGSELTFLGSSGDVMSNNIVDLPDMTLSKKQGIYVPQFPGSADFFMNSVFWLSHEEPMIAISPAAMNVSRIADMSKATLRFWDWGVLMIGLPGLVLVAGAGVYFSRRD
jgi:hypothetical protein